jgi:hypothetical protein
MNNSDEWSNGFEWKGLYIRVLTQYKRIKKLKREIKALNALFFEYIQLIENTKLNEVDNLLSNDFIFPLIGYCEYEDKVIMVSAVIHNYNDNDEINKYDSKLRYDLHNSPLFHNISKLHLYAVVDNLSAQVEKYIIINAYDLFPNLLGNTNDTTILAVDDVYNKITNYKAETYLKYKGINNDNDGNVNCNLLLKSSQYDLKYKIIELTTNSNVAVNDNHHYHYHPLQTQLNSFIEKAFLYNDTTSNIDWFNFFVLSNSLFWLKLKGGLFELTLTLFLFTLKSLMLNILLL